MAQSTAKKKKDAAKRPTPTKSASKQSDAKKSHSVKSDSTKSDSTNAAELRATAALAQAEASVKAAVDAVKDSRKKLRAKAEELVAQTEKLVAKHRKAQRKLEKAEKKASDARSEGRTLSNVPASGASLSPEAREAAVFTPPLPSPQPAAPTLISLRERARARKIPGYSRMSKAALLDSLDDSPPRS
ncbi:MAG: hypothetical protein ABWY54_07580 [Glaciihabitans sp.]